MATVLQSVCPKCQQTLRFPADWLNQPIRCKHCGQTFQARIQPPAGKKSHPPTLSNPGSVPPPLPPSSNRKPTPITSEANLAIQSPTSPVDAHQTFPNTQINLNHDPFEGIHDTEDQSPNRKVKSIPKQKRGPSYFLLGLALFVLASTIGGILAVTQLKTDRIEKSNSKELAVDKNKEKQKDGPAIVPSGTQFPRRALIVSIHNYLYANHVHSGQQGGGHLDFTTFQRALNNALRIPSQQILHLSDEAVKGNKRTPLKSVIEQTVHRFLEESRPQDRIMLFFIGRAVELDGKGFLAPIEGELDNPETLIPLEWFYDELKKCPARQKVFVVDVARLNPSYGRERPDGGPLSPKLDALFQNPPEGVQVLSACSAEQQSYETDYAPIGVFLTSFYNRVSANRDKKKPGALEGTISKPTDSIPLEKIIDAVNKEIIEELKGMKLVQVAKLYGKEKPDGAPYDSKEPLAKTPALPPSLENGANKDSIKLVKDVLDEIGVPAVKVSEEDNALRYDMLPPFEPGKMAKMMQTEASADSNVRKAILKAQAILWAISPETGNLPPAIAAETKKIKASLGVNLKLLRDGYIAPAAGNAEIAFKKGLENDEREVAKMIGSLTDTLEMLDEAAAERDQESPRWQANFDFIRARIQAQIAYLWEYNSMLGAMRKEFPERDANLYNGWRLASLTQPSGDSVGKKLAGLSQKTMEKLAKQYAGTPWEVLAKREKLTALGLEWKAAKVNR